MNISNLYKVEIDHVGKDRDNVYYVMGTVSFKGAPTFDVAFSLYTSGVKSQGDKSRMTDVSLEFNKIGSYTNVQQSYLKLMFKEITDACYLSLLDYLDKQDTRLNH